MRQFSQFPKNTLIEMLGQNLIVCPKRTSRVTMRSVEGAWMDTE